MDKYRHRVVGFYPSLDEVNRVLALMVAKGMAANLLPDGPSRAGADPTADSDDVLKDLLRDGAIGTEVGAGAASVFAAADGGPFLASPALGALYLFAWTASVGGLVGALVGAPRA